MLNFFNKYLEKRVILYYICDMADLNFKTDIKLGEMGEQIVLQDLESMGGKFIKDNKDNKFDLLVERKGKNIKYEIKTEVTVAPGFDTGNLFIETECRGKKSGIEVTEADWFVTYVVYFGEIWYIKTDDLKKLIKENDFRKGIGGDPGSNSTGYLINRENFRDHFIIREAPNSF
jgi:hypothetical protein